ncbi:hypothetical protein AAFF_G00123070 [Aldrovandia affinis]|uniref:Angiopoietin-like protein 8 n=1 Tax=Aldrovandia affinis TaxID=143900 RepID=A0AAD7RRK8_9TELE|nr:hypothetical protein AAFF_G00123070 [Aldrovandia affinis]
MRGSLPLLCVALWAAGAPGAAGSPAEGPKVASVRDVNVLMYGVLQFGDALQHVYHSIGGGMTRIYAALQRQEGALRALREEVARATRREGQIRDALSHVQTQSAGLHAQAAQMRTMLREVEKEEAELQNQVTGLEKTIEGSAPNVTTLKDLALQGSNVLKALVKWTQDQRRILEGQDEQLSLMQRRSNEP